MPAKKSLVDAAYDVLTRRYDEKKESVPMAFTDLLLAVGQELGIVEESDLIDIASKFYTALTVDGRFVIKENNTWVLRDHELFSNIHIDMNAVYVDDEEEEKDEESEENENGHESGDEDEDEDAEDGEEDDAKDMLDEDSENE